MLIFVASLLSVIFTKDEKFIVVGGTDGEDTGAGYPLFESCSFLETPEASCAKGAETHPELYENCTLTCEAFNETDITLNVNKHDEKLWPKLFKVSDDFCTT